MEALLAIIPSDAYIGVSDLAKKANMDARIVRRVLDTAIQLQYNKVRVKRIGKRIVYTIDKRGRPSYGELEAINTDTKTSL